MVYNLYKFEFLTAWNQLIRSNHEEEARLNNSRVVRSITLLVLTALFFLFYTTPQLNAQPLGSLVTFQDAVVNDEEGNKLMFPSFVLTEPANKEIYVIDSKSRILILTHDLFPVHTLGKRDGIETPQGLAFDARGNLYVSQTATDNNPKNRISVYSSCLKWMRNIYLTGFKEAEAFVPYRLAADENGNLFVVANHFPGVLYIDNMGRLIEILSPEEDGKKSKINNVTVDKDGNIYMVSEEAGRIYVYNKKREFVLKFGEKGGSPGKLSRPKAVSVDIRSGKMYVVDYMRHTITIFNKKGQFIYEFGGLGWGEGWFQYPIDLTVDQQGRLMVADLFNHRVQVFNTW
jgi:DNA-binding beta-propeller fold protein YncE